MGALRLMSMAAAAAAVVAPGFAAPSTVSTVAMCPHGMVPNPAGYGCVPELRSGKAVGAPSEEVLTRCDGNYYICVWPYG